MIIVSSESRTEAAIVCPKDMLGRAGQVAAITARSGLQYRTCVKY